MCHHNELKKHFFSLVIPRCRHKKWDTDNKLAVKEVISVVQTYFRRKHKSQQVKTSFLIIRRKEKEI